MADVASLLLTNITVDLVGEVISASSRKIRSLFDNSKEAALKRAIEAGMSALLEAVPPPRDEESAEYKEMWTSFFKEPIVHSELSKLILGFQPDYMTLIRILNESDYGLQMAPDDIEAGLSAFIRKFQEVLVQEPSLYEFYQLAQQRETLIRLENINEQQRRSFEKLKQELDAVRTRLNTQLEFIEYKSDFSATRQLAPTEIRSGPVEVLSSGTVISYQGNPVEINFGPSTRRLKLILEFQDDGKERSVEGVVVSETVLKLVMHNFDDPLGIGTNKPIPIGAIEGKEVKLQYRIFAGESADKTVHYTIYLSEEENK